MLYRIGSFFYTYATFIVFLAAITLHNLFPILRSAPIYTLTSERNMIWYAPFEMWILHRNGGNFLRFPFVLYCTTVLVYYISVQRSIKSHCVSYNYLPGVPTFASSVNKQSLILSTGHWRVSFTLIFKLRSLKLFHLLFTTKPSLQSCTNFGV